MKMLGKDDKMVIFHMNLHHKIIIRMLFLIFFIGILFMFAIGIHRIFFQNDDQNQGTNCINSDEIRKINARDYTAILKEVHENMNSYLGKKIQFTGFVYRLNDFHDDQFVLGRYMLISSDYQAVVVGFLCELPNAKYYKDGCWIEIQGIIKKGDYHGEIPVIEITSIQEVETPKEEFVLPPDESYIQTSQTL